MRLETTTAISTGAHREGDAFATVLNAPLRRQDRIFVPMGASVDGVIEEATAKTTGDEPARIAVRITKLQLPNGQYVDLEANSITREAKPVRRAETVDIMAGLDTTIEELTGKSAEKAASGEAPDQHAVIPADSPLVFTLSSDLTIPASR